MKTKNKIKLGLFKYDLFPYFVLHTIYGEKNGGCQIVENYNEWISKDRLICYLPIENKEKIENKIEELKNEYSERVQDLKNILLCGFNNFIDDVKLEKYFLKIMKKK